MPPSAKAPRPIFVAEFVEILFVDMPYVVTPVFVFAPDTVTFTPVLAPMAVLPETAISNSLPVVSELLAMYAPVPVVNELALKTNPEDVVILDVLLVRIFAPEPTNNPPDTPTPPETTKAPVVVEPALVLFIIVATPLTCKVDLSTEAPVTPNPPEILTPLLTPTAEFKLVAPSTLRFESAIRLSLKVFMPANVCELVVTIPDDPEPASGKLNVCIDPDDTILKSVPDEPTVNDCSG